ncbi:MAG TPA: HEAT repeat domain-containing protein [Thermoguttaceae bacterium]|nr:HEAT repeat domain-containing protein [Thermoguttaceae bacterium]
MLDQAFEALKTYDWGQDRNLVEPIREAVVASADNADERKALETRLADVLKTDVSYDSKQFVCRELMIIGTAASVPTLAALLTDEKMAHVARYALERVTAPEAAKALRDALGTTKGELKIGVIASLGVRGEAESVAPIAALLGDSDAAIVRSAAIALGAIRSSAAAKALAGAKPTAETQTAISDALLACAEALLADGNKAEALTIYKGLLSGDKPKQVKLAASRGLLACAGK